MYANARLGELHRGLLGISRSGGLHRLPPLKPPTGLRPQIPPPLREAAASPDPPLYARGSDRWKPLEKVG